MNKINNENISLYYFYYSPITYASIYLAYTLGIVNIILLIIQLVCSTCMFYPPNKLCNLFLFQNRPECNSSYLARASITFRSM